MMTGSRKIICVDLDGTLIRTDLLFETFLLFAVLHPLRLLILPVILLSKGRGALKRYLASRILFSPGTLPFNQELIEYLTDERKKGAKIVLASASDQTLLDSIAEHLQLFDEVIGSTSERNLKGKHKAHELVCRYGERGFIYAGDCTADMAVWQLASGAIVVNDSGRFVAKVASKTEVIKNFMSSTSKFMSSIQAMRIYQWVKNLLLFVPIIMAHQWKDTSSFMQVVYSFFAFSLCASSVYIVNDLMDLESDREHHRKKNRPFASGALTVQWGLVMATGLLLSSALLAHFVSTNLLLALSGYFVITTAYSVWLKKIVLVDIITLASLYSMRIFTGAVAANVHISQWLLAFSMFLFFSLACMKRYSELRLLRKNDMERAHGRGYLSHDLEMIAQFGSSSGYIAILVLALYFNSEEVRMLYGTPKLLWLICPAFFYWISRVWLYAGRGEMHDDPIIFALKDVSSYCVGVIVLFCAIFSL